MFVDYYAILEIECTASQNEIKSAYRRLAKMWHPDVNKNLNAHEKMIEITDAYQFLSDEEKRKVYDVEYDLFKQSQTVKVEDYTIQDENLDSWIKESREKAKSMYNQVIEEFRETIKSSEKGIMSYLNYIWPFILGLFLFKMCASL